MPDETLKARRIKKLGNKLIEEMSLNTRKKFKSWGHRAVEIRNWEKQNKPTKKGPNIHPKKNKYVPVDNKPSR